LAAAVPSWSPDGNRIAFTANQPGRPSKIYIVPVDGGAPQQAMSTDQDENDPTWSPDGKSLAFGVRGPGRNTTIHVLEISSQRITTLPGSEGFWGPRWSPDGRYIVAQPSDQQKLLLLDMNNQKWAELVGLPAAYYQWSQNGKFIYFDVSSAVEPAIYRIRATDPKLERVVSLKGYRRASGFYGPWMGLAPDDSPLLLRDVGIQEIYALDWEAP
jgi:Tol biopolymer transport system component